MPETSLEEALLSAWQHHAPKPLSTVPLTLDEAYVIQRRYAALRDAPAAGYKAAVTHAAGQQALGLDEPIFGVLFSGTRVSLIDVGLILQAAMPVIETEVGFILASDIEAPVDAATVIKHLAGWQPMLEFGDVGFTGRPTPADLVAGNAAGAWYLASDLHHDAATANDAVVRLNHNGERVHEAPASDAMGHQLQAVAWMINKALVLGYELSAGMVMMTGALGNPVPAKPGRWVADYGEFGRIEFEL